MNKILLVTLIAVVLIGIALSAYYLTTQPKQKPQESPEIQAEKIVEQEMSQYLENMTLNELEQQLLG